MSEIIQYRSGYKYQLTEPYWSQSNVTPSEEVVHGYFRIHPNGWFLIQAGYAWDGPSGPTFDTKSFMRGSLRHDMFYQAMSLGRLDRYWREAADQDLRDCCRADGMSMLRAWWV